MRALAALAAMCALAGCKERSWSKPDVNLALVEVVADKLAVRHGEVTALATPARSPTGVDTEVTQATYVLVEARNRADQDLMITLSGALIDASGDPLGGLRKESLRVPGGGSRLFALVNQDQKPRPGATGARVEVVGAMPVDYAPPFVVTDGNVYRDQNRAVVAGNVVNTAARPGAAIVVFAFFDEEGRPMQRPSTLFKLDAGGKRGAQMVGPDGSHSAYLFIGEVTY